MNTISNNKKYNKIIIFHFLTILICILFFHNYVKLTSEKIILKSQENNKEYEINLCKNVENNLSTFDFDNQEKTKFTYSYKFINILPVVSNLQCIGKVVEVWGDKAGYHLLIGTNKKFYDLLFGVLNLYFIFLMYLVKKTKNILISDLYILLISVIICNLFLNYVFFRIPGSIFENFIINIKWYLSVFLIYYSYLIKNNLIFIVGCYYLLTFDYDYFGLFVFIYLVSNKFKLNLKKFEKIIVYFIPFWFFVLRILSSLSNKFDQLWSNLFQKFYFGYSRFIDLQSDFYILSCNSGSSADSYNIKFTPFINYCPNNIGYGPIRKLIPIYSEVWITVLFTMTVLALLILLQYYTILKNSGEEILFLTLLFVSPSLNLLIHLGNPDIFYFALVYFVLKNYEKNIVLNTFLIYILSLWKIHAIGILFGLFIFSMTRKYYRNLFINGFFILLTFLTYVIDTKSTEPLVIPSSPDERMGYGILHDATQLTKYFSYGNQIQVLIFIIILGILSLMLSLRFTNFAKSTTLSSFQNYKMYGYAFWFFLTFIYQNQSYRLPLFIFLFYILYKNSNNQIKFFITCAIFLNPVISINNLIIEKTSLVLNRVGIYSVFSLLLTIFILDIYKIYVSKFVKIKLFEFKN